MSKKRIMKSVKALLLCGVIATSSIAFAGCDVNAKSNAKGTLIKGYTQFTMECCGNAKLYGYAPSMRSCRENKMSLSNCKYFTCTTSTGRYTIYSHGKGIGIWTVNSKGKKSNRHDGEIHGSTITIAI